MTRVLLVYGTTDGHTRRIARFMAEALELCSVDTVQADVSAALPAHLDVKGFDGAIVLGSVRMGRHPKGLVRFVREHRKELDAIPNAFVSVSLSAGKEKPSAKREVAETFRNFTRRTSWRPDAQVPIAGALPYSKYPLRIRLVMKLIAWITDGDTDTSRDYTYTDWDAVADFARRFAGALEQAPIARAAQAEIEMRPPPPPVQELRA